MVFRHFHEKHNGESLGEYIVYQDGGILNILGNEKEVSLECQCFSSEDDYICIVGNSILFIYKHDFTLNNLLCTKKIPKRGIKHCMSISESKGVTFFITSNDIWRIITISENQHITCENGMLKMAPSCRFFRMLEG